MAVVMFGCGIKKAMRKDILEGLQKEVYSRCLKETNKFGMGCYYHIAAVVKNAEILAERFGADKEIVMIAAWLHDIASVTDYSLYKQHHIYGAEMAYGILKEYNYDDEKIALVQDCIKKHRGSVWSERDSLEELCVADAENGMGIEEGREFVRNKWMRSFQKLSECSAKYYKIKFDKVMEVLN